MRRKNEPLRLIAEILDSQAGRSSLIDGGVWFGQEESEGGISGDLLWKIWSVLIGVSRARLWAEDCRCSFCHRSFLWLVA